MRLPHQLINSQFFVFTSKDDLIEAVKGKVSSKELEQIDYLSSRNLPPITSPETLATMLGVNSGLIWSFVNRPARHYRTFPMKKGQGVRIITAPRVALKVVQKWISIHIERSFTPPDFVFGFARGRSHIGAAERHIGAKWAYSVDLADFFRSTPENLVVNAFHTLGYDLSAAKLLARLSCVGGALAQGSPASPTISNICFADADQRLKSLSERFNCVFTRYADDLTFSGSENIPDELPACVEEALAATPWKVAPHKVLVQPLKGRIKIHGLLIQDKGVRLTKGYRNKIRAYAHVIKKSQVNPEDLPKLRGHLQYASHVEKITSSPSGIPVNLADWRHYLPTYNKPPEAGKEVESPKSATGIQSFFRRIAERIRSAEAPPS